MRSADTITITLPIIAIKPSRPVLERVAVSMLLAVILGMIHQHLGMIQFGGMDGSALIQGAWRYSLGQKIYVDFICTAPPIFVVPPGLMFKWFGPSWENLVTLGTIFTTITYFVMVWTFRRMGWSFILSAGFAFAVESFTMIPLGWWGYNPLAQVAGVIFIGSSMLLMQRPESLTNRALYTLSLVLLSWMKPNVAGFLILSVFLVCIINRKSRWVALSMSILAALLSVGLMLLANINPVDLVNSYLSAAGRVSNHFMLTQCSWFVGKDTGVILALLIPVTVAAFLKLNDFIANKDPNLKQVLPTLLLAAVAIAGAVIAKISNMDDYLTDVSLFIFGLFLIIYSTTPVTTDLTEQKVKSHRPMAALQSALVASSLTFLVFFSFIESLARERIREIGEGLFFENKELKLISNPEFFRGMTVGPTFESVLTILSEVTRGNGFNVKSHDDVFFGTRMEFGYAAYNCIPPKGLFLWWPTPGEANPEVVAEAVKKFKEWSPKTCIFYQTDFTYLPQEIAMYLIDNYSAAILKDILLLTKKS